MPLALPYLPTNGAQGGCYMAKILLTGATGFVGRPLVAQLAAAGHDCWVVSRRPEQTNALFPAGVTPLAYDSQWPAAQAVIHLAGESIVGLWTAEKRRRIMASRVQGTRQVVDWMVGLESRPEVLLSMSAVGLYGDRPGEILGEQSKPDPLLKFRAKVCLAWEREANQATKLGVRVVNLRLGNVLHPSGGYLGKLLELYRWLPILAMGNPQAMLSWISLPDACRLIEFALTNQEISGPLNLTAPNPVSQAQFFQTLAHSLGRRVSGRLPVPLLRLAMGAFADAFLDWQDVRPDKALAHHFQFTHPNLGGVMSDEL